MGEIADMMLEGQLCQGCGEFLGDGDGFPVYCPSCQDERDGIEDAEPPARRKVKCPECDRLVFPSGVSQHLRDKHGLI